MSQASSPCIGLCTLDEAGGLCLGCGRTVDEIGRWSSLSEPERRRIMTTLAARLAAPPGRTARHRTAAADGVAERR